MTPDPVFDNLARFTPSGGPDVADILFAAGRASAPTPLVWKLAVAGLVLTNLVAVGVLLFGTRPATPVQPAPEPVAVPVIVPVPVPEPTSPSPESPGGTVSPWSVGSLHAAGDADQLPRSEPLAGVQPAHPPLTPSAGRGGEID